MNDLTRFAFLFAFRATAVSTVVYVVAILAFQVSA